VANGATEPVAENDRYPIALFNNVSNTEYESSGMDMWLKRITTDAVHARHFILLLEARAWGKWQYSGHGNTGISTKDEPQPHGLP
jgi:hypothetical protein